MAVKKQAEVHAFRRIAKDLKENTLKNILLLYGREKYLIRWSVDEVKNRFINPAVEMFDYVRIDGTTAEPYTIIEACETLPMMSEKRVVLVENLNLTADNLEELAEYLAGFPDHTMLVITAATIDKKRKIFKAIQKHGAEYDFGQLQLPELRSFITKRLRKLGVEFGAEVPAMIAESSGYYAKESEYTIDNLINDLEKIAAHAGGRITAEDIEDSVAGTVDRNVFAFADALAAGRRGEALDQLGVLLRFGENEFKLLGLICSQFETVLLVNEMKRDGMMLDQMKTHLGIHEFRIKKALSLASRYDAGRLRRILMKAYEVDRNIKTGLSEPVTALELLVAGV